MTQTILTVVTPVKAGEQGALRNILDRAGYVGPLPSEDVFGFAEAEMLHFASLFLYDDSEDGWFLVFESNIDGEIDAYLDRLLEIAEARDGGAFLVQLYGRCSGFGGDDLGTLKRYLRAHVHGAVAGFVSAVGMTRNRIRQDAAIYRVADEALAAGVPPLPPEQARDTVFAALEADPETQEVVSNAGDDGIDLDAPSKRRAAARLLFNALGFLTLAVVNLVLERTARQDGDRPDNDLVRSQRHYEDRIATNHMVSVVHLHTDPGRQWAKRCAYGILQSLVDLVFRKGKLGRIETIHFAHWAILNKGRRLLFVSNFNGSWASYLDDFTLKANNGLTLAWAHGIGFPKSWLMIFGGAAKGPEFIDWARRSMVPTLVWYSAYPGQSVKAINRNRRLRQALVAANAGGGDTAWLELL